MFTYHDGGRKEAGFKGKAGDCVVRAIAITTGLPYQQVYDELNEFAGAEKFKRGKIGMNAAIGKGSSARTGVFKATYKPYLESLGFKWTPTMRIGQGCRVHLCPEELPKGKIIAQVSRHLVAVIDGVIYDTFDSSREGKRCVYGYYSL